MKKNYTSSLLEEISQLKQELKDRNAAAAQREEEHIDQLARQAQ